MSIPRRPEATYTAAEIPYSAEWEDAFMELVLNPPASTTPGLRIVANKAPEKPNTMREKDFLANLPSVEFSELPLSLDDPRRVFASPIPGLKVTHPNGYFEGGPSQDAWDARETLERKGPPKGVSLEEALKALEKANQKMLSKLREQMATRKANKEHNDKIQKRIRDQELQHEMEVRALTRMAAEKVQKKSRREKRRKERDGDTEMPDAEPMNMESTL